MKRRDFFKLIVSAAILPAGCNSIASDVDFSSVVYEYQGEWGHKVWRDLPDGINIDHDSRYWVKVV